MRVLIVGAGAVGQVYGRHLQLGGADVSFFVKPKYADDARSGFVVYPLNRRDPTAPVRFEGFGVVTSPDEVAASPWDQVWLAISSTALDGAWLPALLAAAPGATVVSLVPGTDVSDRLAALVGPDRVASGLISLISYAAPLPGETRFPEPGTAYWFPPLGPSPFSGPDAVVDRIVATLRAGGQPATKKQGLDRRQGFAMATLTAFLLALESVGWSLTEVRRREHLAPVSAAVREAHVVVGHQTGERPPAWRFLIRPLTLRAALALSRRVIPLDLEAYLRVHFLKVHDQTMAFVRQLSEHGHQHGLPTSTLDALFAKLPGSHEA